MAQWFVPLYMAYLDITRKDIALYLYNYCSIISDGSIPNSQSFFLFKPVSLLMKNDEVENYLILKQKYLVVEGIFAKREDEEE